MSLRDDLELCFACISKQVHTNEVIAIAEAMNRLRAALSPAAEKWLEALPKLLELQANLKNAVHTEYLEEFNLQVALRGAIYEAAALHAAASAVNAEADNKEQK